VRTFVSPVCTAAMMGSCQFSMVWAKPIASGTFAGGKESVEALLSGMDLVAKPIAAKYTRVVHTAVIL
jgi:hypothetical protein